MTVTPGSSVPDLSGPSDPSDLAHLSNDLRLTCMRIARRVRFEATDALAPHLFSVLVRLEPGPLTPGELAEIERVSAPSMTRTVAALVGRGLVTRAADPVDRRQVIVAITGEGTALVAATRAQREAWMASRVARLTPGEQAVLAEAAQILAKVAAQ